MQGCIVNSCRDSKVSVVWEAAQLPGDPRERESEILAPIEAREQHEDTLCSLNTIAF